jgi:hypothetical protein
VIAGEEFSLKKDAGMPIHKVRKPQNRQNSGLTATERDVALWHGKISVEFYRAVL